MGSKKTLETFNISGIIRAQVTVQIEANNFQEAIEKAKELDVKDFVEILGDYDDGELIGISYIGADDYSKGFKLK
jgi:hypothetical protein